MPSQKNDPSGDPAAPLDYYASAEAWKPSATTTLPDLIEAIRGDEFSAKVAEIRSLIEAGDKDAADTLKKQLPAISISGSVKGRRKKALEEGRFHHSALMQVDLDAKDHPSLTLAEMRSLLIADPHTVACFLSPSGNGIKGVCRVPADAAGHKSAFLAAEAHYASLGLIMDKACKDPVRLCFVSHDPDAWIRPLEGAAEILPAIITPPDPSEEPEIITVEMTEEARENNAPNLTSRCAAGGLVIRATRPPLDAFDVAEMLRSIPPRPDYSEWLKIASAVWDALGESEGTAALCSWSPEEKAGEYAAKYQHRLEDVSAGSLVFFAQQHGWAPPAPDSPVVAKTKPASAKSSPAPAAKPVTISEKLSKEKSPAPKGKNLIPETVFPVPAGEIGFNLSASHIFTIVSPSRRLFMRGGAVHEIESEDGGYFSLKPVNGDRFASLVETFGPRVMRRETREDGTPRWRSTTLTASASKVLLASDGARDSLPVIRQLVSAPVIVPDGSNTTAVLDQGYHPHAGGTFVTSPARTPEIPLEEAVTLIHQLLCDFDFTSGGDASRAIASIISPAMKIGGWINDDFPLDVAEADQSQAGKSYRHKLIQSIYRETPSTITSATGGVGSLDERVAAALIAGRPIIVMDNFRGRMDSQTLESALRGQGRVNARALRVNIDIDCSPFLWQLSTNGAELTRDLANRSIITRIRKREPKHVFQIFPEGELINHVKANQPKYLGAVHAVVREWAAQGCPLTDESRHDFRAWCRSMDWIVQNIFNFPPLLDGHREEQLRTANPKLQWLRDVINATLADGYEGHGITATDLGDTAEHHELNLPGRRSNSNESLEVAVGKTLGRLFKDAEDETIVVDGRRFSRQVSFEEDPINRTKRERKVYVIEDL